MFRRWLRALTPSTTKPTARRAGNRRPGVRPALEALEERCVPTVNMILYSTSLSSSYAGVGFTQNVVAEFAASVNGFQDRTASDFRVQVDWGDGTGWTNADLALKGDGSSIPFQVKGSHVYNQIGTFDVTVLATGPDGSTLTRQTARASVAQMPSGLGGSVPPVPARSLLPSQVSLLLYSESLNPSLTGVGFAQNVVADLDGSLNGQQNKTVSDYHAYINWGDSTDWTPATIVPTTGWSIPFQVKGSHVYENPGTYDVVVYAVGPDGTSLSRDTARASVSGNPVPTPSATSFVIAGDGTLWETSPALPGNHWAQISAGVFSSISATHNAQGDAVVFAVIAWDHSLWEYNPQFNPTGDVTSHWALVSPGAFAAVSATQSAAGDPVAFAIVAWDRSLWEYNPAYAPWAPLSARWAEVSPGAFASISATQDRGNAPAVYAIVAGDHSLWLNDPALNPYAPPAAQWAEVSPGYFASVSVTHNRNGDPVIYAIVAAGSLWVNDPSLNPSGPLTAQWAEVSAGVFSAVGASRNAAGDAVVFAVVGDGSLWLNDPALNPYGPPAARWAELSGVAFTALGANGSEDAFGVVGADHSVWEYRHAVGWVGLPMPLGETALAAAAP
jgi:hypothetical protein